ncbi:MAG: hypothetical protein AB7O43_18385 [Hyphomicrobiaceae bacterium]
MAGSFGHVVRDGKYGGTELLENMGDMKEAVEEMAFVLLSIMSKPGGGDLVRNALEDYHECSRGERAWPDWFENRE